MKTRLSMVIGVAALFLLSASFAYGQETDLSMRRALYFTGTKTDKIDLKNDKYVAAGAAITIKKSEATMCDNEACTFNVGFIAIRKPATGPLTTSVLYTGKWLVSNSFQFPDKEATVQRVLPLRLVPGIKTQVFATIDPDNKIPETDEGNNSFSVWITVESVASAQRESKLPSLDKITSQGSLVERKDKQREQIFIVAAKNLNVDRKSLEVNPGALKLLTPDLTITGVKPFPPKGHVVIVENIGPVDAGPCKLRFMYGMTWDALESIDLDVPAIPAGKSKTIHFQSPNKSVHWWLFGVDVDNKLGEANFSNNVYVVEFTVDFNDAP